MSGVPDDRMPAADSDRKCGECGQAVPTSEVMCLCDHVEAKNPYCAACFASWGCEARHGEGCATYVFDAS